MLQISFISSSIQYVETKGKVLQWRQGNNESLESGFNHYSLDHFPIFCIYNHGNNEQTHT